MKRTSLRRKKRPKRSRRQMRARSQTSKHARRPRFVDYMLEVKKLPCAALTLEGHRCQGPTEADHAGNRFNDGDGARAHDSTCIPLCQLAHRQRHDFKGPFARWTGPQMRAWLDGRIAQTQNYLRAHGVVVPVTHITTAPPPLAEGTITVSAHGRIATATISNSMDAAALARVATRLAEDLREDGNIDVRHPEAIEGNAR